MTIVRLGVRVVRLCCLALSFALVACAQHDGGGATDSSGSAQATSGGEGASYGGDSDEMVVTGSRIRSASFAPVAAQAYDSEESDGDEYTQKARETRSATEYAEAGAPAAEPAPAPAPGPAPQAPGLPAADTPVERHDGRTGPLLIYEANLHLAVYKVEEVQQQAIAVVKELGGFLALHADRQRLVLRVPADRFDTAVERIEALGQVVHRQITSQDVSEQFRDLRLRLRNAEAMRDRLASLLDKATNVTQSLEVERELNRVSEQIELLKGKLAVLSDRIAFSTLTLDFTPKREETIDPEFQLPFAWLRGLGLQPLLSMP